MEREIVDSISTETVRWHLIIVSKSYLLQAVNDWLRHIVNIQRLVAIEIVDGDHEQTVRRRFSIRPMLLRHTLYLFPPLT